MQNKIYKDKRGGVSIAIALLVIATLAICFFSIYTFSHGEKVRNEKISSSNEINEAYAKEYILNYHINNIMKDISSRVTTKEELLARFNAVLINYRDDAGNYYVGGFEQIQEQLVLDNVEIKEGMFILTLRFELDYGDDLSYNFRNEYFGKV